MAHIERNPKLLDAALQLRKHMTRQEKHLWYDFLSTYPVHWYKQRIIGRYIVDFYCSAAHLIVELDGSQHYTEDGFAQDASRTEFLEGFQLEVMRFPNNAVDGNFEGVCQSIELKMKENMKKYGTLDC